MRGPSRATREPRPRSEGKPREGARQNDRLRRAVQDALLLARDAGLRWADDACYRLGAALAYYALFSLFPLLLLSVTVVGFILGNDDTVRQKVVGSMIGASGEPRALLDQTLQSMQTHRAARGVGALVGGIALLLGASGVFSELESSLNFIWRVESKATGGLWSTLLKALKAKAFAFAVVVAAASAVLASLIVSTVLGAIASTTSNAGAGHALWRLIDFATSLAFVTVLLAAIYRIVPSRRVQWGDVFGAAFVASVLLTTLKYLLAWYLANVGSYAAYGAVGAVLGLLTWIYCASLVLFYGAEVSVLYADRFGSVARARRASAGDVHSRC